MTRVAIIEYNAGNTLSVSSALLRLGADVVVSRQVDEIRSADKVIFPGVGHAAAAVNWLKHFDLFDFITELSQPVLGICLGMQLMSSFCEEGQVSGLNLFDAECLRFELDGLKVPHMGWNQVSHQNENIFKDISQESYFYFVHSYRISVCADTIAECEYGSPFSAALRKENFFGVQFHPEKSGEAGQKLLSNFLAL
jgi:glutamine amidotransferase